MAPGAIEASPHTATGSHACLPGAGLPVFPNCQ
jgi:hypothetical protein